MISRIAWQRLRFGGRDDVLYDVMREFLVHFDPARERDEVAGEVAEPPAPAIAEDPRDDPRRRNRRY
jgi:hypothetical protein